MAVPYLGSKISLVSKSEIRYEGILYTIDAQESIIALAKVRSFGTEDRPAQIPVQPSEEIFEYIIFKGSDIKKIEVCESANPPTVNAINDPAIVKAGNGMRPSLGPIGGTAPPPPNMFGGYPQQPIMPVQQNFQMQPRQSQPSELRPVDVGAPSLPTPIGPPGGSRAYQVPQQSVPQHSTPQLLQQERSLSPQELGDLLSRTKSQSPTLRPDVAYSMAAAGVMRTKSPVTDAATQVTSPAAKESTKVVVKEERKEVKEEDNTEEESDRRQGGQSQWNNRNGGQRQQNFRRGNNQSYGGNNQSYGGNNQSYGNQGGYGGAQQAYGGYNQAYRNQGYGYRQNDGGYRNQNDGYRNDGDGYRNQGYNNRGGYRNDFGNNQGYGNQYYNGGGYHQGRGNMRGGAGMRGGRGRGGAGRGTGIPQPLSGAPGKPQFQEEYDFEHANEQFEEIRMNLAKVAISSNNSTTTEHNGEEVSEHEGDESVAEESADSSALLKEVKDAAANVCYNKQKSFFDTISSDSAQKIEGGRRINWQEEREKDRETFGASANRRGGYYRGRGRGGPFRGGSGYYRGNNNFRGGARFGAVRSEESPAAEVAA